MSRCIQLFDHILHSSLWQERVTTRILWITLLLMADPVTGQVQASVPGLAKQAGITMEECEQGLTLFQSPDPYSRTKAMDGQRIKEVHGGWQILNYRFYRDLTLQLPSKPDFYAPATPTPIPAPTIAIQSPISEPSATPLSIPEPVAPQPVASTEPKKSTPKSRRYSIAALAVDAATAVQIDRLWQAWPKEGWNFDTRKAAPRRVNYAQYAENFKAILDHTDARKAEGERITAEDLTEASLEWLAKQRKKANDGIPCVPCINNFFSSVETSKRWWQDALLGYFGMVPA